KFKKIKGRYSVFVGNKKLTQLKPQYFNLTDGCQDKLDFVIDGKEHSLSNTSDFYVTADFRVIKNKKQRVNIIGYQPKGHIDESDITISLKKLNKNYSVDKQHKIYRVEFYQKEEFCSMLMVHFK
ncbi:hypothetical protein JHD46_03440, partial [Sulfurimonas sp. SAG-AH-194-C20]